MTNCEEDMNESVDSNIEGFGGEELSVTHQIPAENYLFKRRMLFYEEEHDHHTPTHYFQKGFLLVMPIPTQICI